MMTLKEKIKLVVFGILPTVLLSKIVGLITSVPFPQFILKPAIAWYCRKFSVKQQDFRFPEEGFSTFNSFFTRPLIDGARIIDRGKKTVVSPVDGRIDGFGKIEKDKLFQAKGMEYALQDLVPSDFHKHFINGSYITLYLSPGDYHRIHSPVAGKVHRCLYVPGRLYTVQKNFTENIPGLYVKNRRVIACMETNRGMCAVCMVGAFNVGGITLSFGGDEINKLLKKKKTIQFSGIECPRLQKGEELGIFNMGSTVILLFQNGSGTFEKLTVGKDVPMGVPIARFR